MSAFGTKMTDLGRAKVDEPTPVRCSGQNCEEAATILHKLNPYCGAHALQLLEAGEGFERRLDLIAAQSRSPEEPRE